MVIVVMGVTGCGKTTIGKQLAARLGWLFYDADDFHPQANIDKMRRGEALTDDDRWPWLDRLRELCAQVLQAGEHAVLACSALRKTYRDRLRPPGASVTGPGGLAFVYLHISPEVSRERVSDRPHHYMPASLVASQFEELEPPQGASPDQPDYALELDGTHSVDSLVTEAAEAVKRLKQLPGS